MKLDDYSAKVLNEDADVVRTLDLTNALYVGMYHVLNEDADVVRTLDLTNALYVGMYHVI